MFYRQESAVNIFNFEITLNAQYNGFNNRLSALYTSCR